MSREQLKSARLVITDEARRDALVRASQILRGLGSEITTRLLSARAARLIPGASEGLLRDYLANKMTAEERAVLGIRNRAIPSSKTVALSEIIAPK